MQAALVDRRRVGEMQSGMQKQMKNRNTQYLISTRFLTEVDFDYAFGFFLSGRRVDASFSRLCLIPYLQAT